MNIVKEFNQGYNLHNISNIMRYLDDIDEESKNTDILNEFINISNGNIKELYDKPVLAICTGIYHIYETKNLELAEKYILMALVMNNPNNLNNPNYLNNLNITKLKLINILVMNILGIIYEEKEEYDLAEISYLNTLEHSNYPALLNLADLYKKLQKFDLAEKYYLIYIKIFYFKVCEKDFIIANGLDQFYMQNQHSNEFEKYYDINVDKNYFINAIYNLASVYEEMTKFDLAGKYYVIAIERNHTNALNKLEYMLKNNNLKLYHFLSTILNKSNTVNKKIEQLEYYFDIFCFKNKKLYLSKEAECPICYETKKVIPRECAHFFCLDCFVNIINCAVCRI